MKKTSLLLVVLFTIGIVKAEVFPPTWYTFSCDATGGTFTPLTGATAVDTLNKIKGDNFSTKVAYAIDGVVSAVANSTDSSEGFPIGFNFNYLGIDVNRFIIVSNGHIILGKDKVPLKSPTNSTVSGMSIGYSEAKTGAAGAKVAYGRENTSVSYKVEGSTPNQVLIVEFLNIGNSAADSVSFQIRLCEGTNNIEMVFGNMYRPSTAANRIRIGLTSVDGANGVYRKPGTNNDWTNTTTEVNNAQGNNYGNLVNAIFPAGTKYTWTYPSNCVAPAVSATSLSITDIGSTFIKGSVTLPANGADGYAIYASNIITSNREQMTLLKEGAIAATADFNTPMTSITSTTTSWKSDIPSSPKKYFYAYMTNYLCIGEKQYGDVIVDSGEFKPLPPTAFTVTVTETGIAISATPNNADDSIIIATTVYMAGDKNGNGVALEGYFGLPSGIVNIGDSLEYNSNLQQYNGCASQQRILPYSSACATVPHVGIVIYKGQSVSNFIYNDNLQSNHVYHFGVWTKDNKGNYSTESERISVLYMPVTPYTLNLTESRR
ncbi:MAG: hypothetical protein LBF01_05640, partial [Bacteroidales bacterium]|nr:hypothetical protein [Bacteroidales bacterium]